MPSTSKKQHNFMAAVANNPAFAKKAGVPQSVGKDFNNADKGKTFKRGGDMAGKMNPGFMAMIAKKKAGAKTGAKAEMPMKKGGATKKMMGGGMAYAKGGSASSRADGVAQKGKTKGMLLKKGGMAC
jgi:hypothetical protein